MKHTSIKSIVGGVLGLLILIGAGTAFVMGQDTNKSPVAPSTGNFSKRSIEGAWTTVLQRKDCQTSVPIGLPGRGLMTFTEDGTVFETTAPAVSFGLSRSPGHGIWVRHNWNHYTATIIIQLLNMDGSFAGLSRITATYHLSDSGDEFTSTESFQLSDAFGNNLGPAGCSTTTGKRLQ